MKFSRISPPPSPHYDGTGMYQSARKKNAEIPKTNRSQPIGCMPTSSKDSKYSINYWCNFSRFSSENLCKKLHIICSRVVCGFLFQMRVFYINCARLVHSPPGFLHHNPRPLPPPERPRRGEEAPGPQACGSQGSLWQPSPMACSWSSLTISIPNPQTAETWSNECHTHAVYFLNDTIPPRWKKIHQFLIPPQIMGQNKKGRLRQLSFHQHTFQIRWCFFSNPCYSRGHVPWPRFNPAPASSRRGRCWPANQSRQQISQKKTHQSCINCLQCYYLCYYLPRHFIRSISDSSSLKSIVLLFHCIL